MVWLLLFLVAARSKQERSKKQTRQARCKQRLSRSEQDAGEEQESTCSRKKNKHETLTCNPEEEKGGYRSLFCTLGLKKIKGTDQKPGTDQRIKENKDYRSC